MANEEGSTGPALERLRQTEKRLAAMADAGLDVGALYRQVRTAVRAFKDGHQDDALRMCDEIDAAAQRRARGEDVGERIADPLTRHIARRVHSVLAPAAQQPATAQSTSPQAAAIDHTTVVKRIAEAVAMQLAEQQARLHDEAARHDVHGFTKRLEKAVGRQVKDLRKHLEDNIGQIQEGISSELSQSLGVLGASAGDDIVMRDALGSMEGGMVKKLRESLRKRMASFEEHVDERFGALQERLKALDEVQEQLPVFQVLRDRLTEIVSLEERLSGLFEKLQMRLGAAGQDIETGSDGFAFADQAVAVEPMAQVDQPAALGIDEDLRAGAIEPLSEEELRALAGAESADLRIDISTDVLRADAQEGSVAIEPDKPASAADEAAPLTDIVDGREMLWSEEPERPAESPELPSAGLPTDDGGQTDQELASAESPPDEASDVVETHDSMDDVVTTRSEAEASADLPSESALDSQDDSSSVVDDEGGGEDAVDSADEARAAAIEPDGPASETEAAGPLTDTVDGREMPWSEEPERPEDSPETLPAGLPTDDVGQTDQELASAESPPDEASDVVETHDPMDDVVTTCSEAEAADLPSDLVPDSLGDSSSVVADEGGGEEAVDADSADEASSVDDDADPADVASSVVAEPAPAVVPDQEEDHEASSSEAGRDPLSASLDDLFDQLLEIESVVRDVVSPGQDSLGNEPAGSDAAASRDQATSDDDGQDSGYRPPTSFSSGDEAVPSLSAQDGDEIIDIELPGMRSETASSNRPGSSGLRSESRAAGAVSEASARIASALADLADEIEWSPTAASVPVAHTVGIEADRSAAPRQALNDDELRNRLVALMPALMSDERVRQALFATLATEIVRQGSALGELTGLRRYIQEEMQSLLSEQMSLG